MGTNIKIVPLQEESNERLYFLLDLYYKYSPRLCVAFSNYKAVVKELDRRGLEIPDWVYETNL